MIRKGKTEKLKSTYRRSNFYIGKTQQWYITRTQDQVLRYRCHSNTCTL